MVAPEKVQLGLRNNDYDDWEIQGYSFLEDKQVGMTEYVRTDAFIEKACEYWYKHNREIVKRYGSRATLGCAEFTVNVSDFRNYLKGE